MKIVVVEDEKPAARRLVRMLETIGLEVEKTLHSVQESIDWFQSNSAPDVLFLDIQLSDGLSFEIFESVSVQSAIIFTTAYDAYALQAFKLNSVDYLLKPIDEDELKTAVEKFKTHRLPKAAVQLDLETIKQLLVHPIDRVYKKRFTIKIGQHLKIIPIEEVVCFYSEHKATYLHTIHGRDYVIDGALESWLTQLDPAQFFRANRTFIIHLSAIKDMVSYTNSRLQIHLHSYTASEIVVSRERVKAFKNWIA